MTAKQSNNALTSARGENRIPTEVIIHLIENEGLTITECAKRVNLNQSNISRRLQKANYTPGYLKSIDRAEISILKQLRHKLLKTIACADLKKVSLQQASTAYAILTDKQLLLEGKPNSIVAYADLVKARELYQAKIKAFEDKYGIKTNDNSNSEPNN